MLNKQGCNGFTKKHIHHAGMTLHKRMTADTLPRAGTSRVRHSVAIYGQLLLFCDQSMRKKAWRSTLLAGAAGELAGVTRLRQARPSSACKFSGHIAQDTQESYKHYGIRTYQICAQTLLPDHSPRSLRGNTNNSS